MGTTTFYLRHNDFGRPLNRMTKKELEKLDKMSPYSKDNSCLGWRVPLELHNGNVDVLVWWKGKLMKLQPKSLIWILKLKKKTKDIFDLAAVTRLYPLEFGIILKN